MEGSHPESFGNGNYESEVPGQQSPTSFGNDSNFLLDGQNPVFSATQDEFLNMREMSSEVVKLDELLNGMWDVEANGTSLDMNQNDMMMVKDIVNPDAQNLQNSFSLPTPPSQRSMDEIWADILRNQYSTSNPSVNWADVQRNQYSTSNPSVNWADVLRNQYSTNNPGINNITHFSQGVNVLGQMTLENYLVRKGIIQAEDLADLHKEANRCINGCEYCTRKETTFDPAILGGDWMFGVREINIPTNPFIHWPPPNSVINIPVHYPVYLPPPRNEIYIPARAPMFPAIAPRGNFMGECFNNIGSGEQSYLNGLGESLQRSAMNGVSQLAAERRERRMIKNRESAARSRARKQGYTMELEIMIHQLRDENAQLKRNLAEIEEKIRQSEAKTEEKITQNKVLKEKTPKKARLATEESDATIRRTSSLGW